MNPMSLNLNLALSRTLTSGNFLNLIYIADGILYFRSDMQKYVTVESRFQEWPTCKNLCFHWLFPGYFFFYWLADFQIVSHWRPGLRTSLHWLPDSDIFCHWLPDLHIYPYRLGWPAVSWSQLLQSGAAVSWGQLLQSGAALRSLGLNVCSACSVAWQRSGLCRQNKIGKNKHVVHVDCSLQILE